MLETFQDRLVTELRLAGASSFDEASLVLQEFLPRINARFTVAAEQPETVSRASTKHTSGAEQKCTTREVIGWRKCPRQLFGRSVTEAGWQQAGRVGE